MRRLRACGACTCVCVCVCARRVEKHGGLITNREVMDVLQGRGANPEVAADPPRARDPAVCEVQVFDTLRQSAAASQSREMIADFVRAVKVWNCGRRPAPQHRLSWWAYTAMARIPIQLAVFRWLSVC